MENTEKKSTKNIKVAFFLNLIFSVIELVGGLLTNSISIISDSVHDFGDALSIGIAFFLEKKSEKEPDKKYTYGYLRYSVLGAFITSIILLTGSIFVIYNAIIRIMNPVDVNYNGMIILAILGLVINGLAAYKTVKGEKINERAVGLHLLEDVLGWAVVLIGSVLMKIFNISLIDPILSIGITIFILYNVIKNLKEIGKIFMEEAPEGVSIEEIQKDLLESNNKIVDIHHIHLWTLDGVNKYITVHVVLINDVKIDEIIKIKKEIRHQLDHNGINHASIEIEFEKEQCEEKNCSIKHQSEDGHHHHHH